ncbi:MAG: N-acetyl-gamma-glutamyl-phosphate reductase [Deltaproteobacteria bacterium]|nr:N-acetyl-gamma-glutamyl-phosphate reductase [Deltaproteobacteria bacterium]
MPISTPAPRPSVCIVGATGYAGQELLRLLGGHPLVGPVTTAPSREGVAAIPADAQWIFLATPAETSAELAGPLVARGQRVIDLSGAHRAGDPIKHRAAYGFEHPHPAALAQAVYGFDAPADVLQQAGLIANPGCYANALLSALVPLQAAGVLAPGAVVDATGISGVSGAGRNPTERTMYMYVAENLAPYRTGRAHQHLVEVEGRAGVHLLFVPLVAPLRRGMLVSGSADVAPWLARNPGAPLPNLTLAGDPLWLQVPAAPDVLAVAEQNTVQVHYFLDAAAGRVQFVSVIDNLLRGAASHAVYNLNLACGWPALTGLQVGRNHD